MSEPHSRLAIALAETIVGLPPTAMEKDVIARVIDQRLAEVRKVYEPEEFARCPIITHHPKGPCAFCCCAAMREFTLLPEEL